MTVWPPLFMKELTTRSLTIEDIPEIRRMAAEIWNAVYSEMLSREQIDYMLDWMYGETQLASELRSGRMSWWFFHLEGEGQPIGYVAGGPGEAEGEWHLHKLYLHPDQHGMGHGTAMLRFLIHYAGEQGYREMTLRVNRNNASALKSYERNGFVRNGEVCSDIGSGFVMDDYWMSRRLP